MALETTSTPPGIERQLDFHFENGPNVYGLTEIEDDEYTQLDLDELRILDIDVQFGKLNSVNSVDRAIAAVALNCGATKVAKFLTVIERKVLPCVAKIPELNVRCHEVG